MRSSTCSSCEIPISHQPPQAESLHYSSRWQAQRHHRIGPTIEHHDPERVGCHPRMDATPTGSNGFIESPYPWAALRLPTAIFLQPYRLEERVPDNRQSRPPVLALGVRTRPRILRRARSLRRLRTTLPQDAPARGRDQTGHHNQTPLGDGRNAHPRIAGSVPTVASPN